MISRILDAILAARKPQEVAGANQNQVDIIAHSNLSCPWDQEGSSPTDQIPSRTARNSKAAKNDDAEIPTFLWDEAIVSDGNIQKLRALDTFRSFALRWWKRHTTCNFLTWLTLTYPQPSHYSVEYSKDNAAGTDCLARCANSSWWEWSAGSRPFFWWWPAEYRATIRDGVKPWIKGPLPEYRIPQRGERDIAVRQAIRKKLMTILSKGCLAQGEVRSLTSFFAVPKGEDDMRIVYDGTKSGLNGQLWAPWLPLPTIDTHLHCIQPGYFMGDIDFSEQFLNFVLHEKVRKYAGVDLTLYFPELMQDHHHVLWMHWERCGMGFVSSPYNAVQGTFFAEEVIRGNHRDPTNILRWDYVLLNLPGTQHYNPSQPWVCKMRLNHPNETPTISNNLVIYVDDVRTTACGY